MIDRIEHRGVLIADSAVPGERRAEGAVPAHPNGIPASRDRWLMLYATRRFRFVDDDCSICYQLRAGAPDGRVLAEGLLGRARGDWDPFGDGKTCFKQHGHPVAFGVPKGARIKGAHAANGNLFVVKWRRHGVRLEKGADGREKRVPDEDLQRRTLAVEWVQVRLNTREDDLEIVQPVEVLRQKGYDGASEFCRHRVAHMNQSFVQAVPFNADATEWADVNHFDRGRIAALKYRFNASRGRYEWVETGPLAGGEDSGLHEASLVRVADGWAVAARRHGNGAVAWYHTEDPFERLGDAVLPQLPFNNSPLTAYCAADGVLRLLSGDTNVSPHQNGRDPLYIWDIDPKKGFQSSNRRVVYDSVLAGLPIRVKSVPRVDMGKLLPHAGGREQYIVHRVRTKCIENPYTKTTINEEEKACCAIYYAKARYNEEYPGAWTFD